MIEILEPESDGVLLHKHGSKVLIWCSCDGMCPQGKVGSQTRCRIWVERDHLTDEGIEHQKAMNRFDR